MAVSERAIGNALAWPTPLACLYSLAMETEIGIRDCWHEDIAAMASPAPALLISSTGGSWRSRSPGPAANGSGACDTDSA